MCHRYNIKTAVMELVDSFQAIATNPDLGRIYDGKDRYPLTEGLVIHATDEGRELSAMTWGMVPHWLTDKPKSYVRKYSTFNARCETAHEKATFKSGFKSRRCIVPVDRFFEPPNNWFTLNGHGVFALAGLWSPWPKSDEGDVNGYTILTTEPNELVSAHRTGRKRQPVILDTEEKIACWLNPDHKEPEPLRHLFEPLGAELMGREENMS